MTPDALAALRAIFADPQRADQIPPDEAAALMANLAAVQWALASRLRLPTTPASDAPTADADRLLAPTEAAERLGVTVRWLYRHAGHLPYTRRLSRKVLRFSEAGVNRFLEGKQR
jgi:predicted DNA-binding transcriptional regulator AlpA